MSFPVTALWLISALPLFAAAVSALMPRESRKTPAALAIAAIALAAGLSCWALWAVLHSSGTPLYHNFPWFDAGLSTIELGWMLDPLGALMLVMVTTVGLLIFIFSLGYMADDPRVGRFFCYLSFFAGAMLGLLIANSLLLVFVCWELVGLASYLLIGFWFHKPEAAAAAKKAFIVTRIGDLGFLLGLLWLYDATGTLLFYDAGRGCLESGALNALASQFVVNGLGLSTAIGLLLFCGAVGKSGQFPLHVWLPDAMEGPTPVSALIHAATMVAAGVFLVARVYPLMAADLTLPGLQALTVVAWTGAITALLGALIAVAQTDLKRVLAYSTLSQLGYMMLALGVGAWEIAIFHLLTHAFFKALLFLGAGSVIHATHHEQDIRKLGGLSARLKITFVTFSIGSMALAGVPFFFSGFWSKEAILHATHVWPVSNVPFSIALAAVVLTAFYSMRLVAEVFLGKAPRDPQLADHPPRESPRTMTLPLCILAVGAVGLGFLGTPAWPWLQSTLLGRPVRSASLLDGIGLSLISIAAVAVGVAAAAWLYVKRPRTAAAEPDPLERWAPGLFAGLRARLGFDELYAATIGRLNRFASMFAQLFDRWIVERIVGGFGYFAEFVGLTAREVDEEGLNSGFDRASGKLKSGGAVYSKAQSGKVQGYLSAMAMAFAVLALILLSGVVR